MGIQFQRRVGGRNRFGPPALFLFILRVSASRYGRETGSWIAAQGAEVLRCSGWLTGAGGCSRFDRYQNTRCRIRRSQKYGNASHSRCEGVEPCLVFRFG